LRGRKAREIEARDFNAIKAPLLDLWKKAQVRGVEGRRPEQRVHSEFH
jgi:hypothetical protein